MLMRSTLNQVFVEVEVVELSYIYSASVAGQATTGQGAPRVAFIRQARLVAASSLLAAQRPPTSYLNSASVGRQAASRETADALYVIACRRASAVARLAPLHSFG
ncbi:hypothetical protein BHE74_00035364 [Ensete ventricosum]|nr:hypothetical protein BHE74_00035364 [Ensete ventricosum]